GQESITDDLDVQGPGPDELAVSGNHASRVVAVSGGVVVNIAGLTISDGRVVGGGGGGIRNAGSTLALVHVVLSNNQALGAPGGAGQGGAIGNVSGATLTVSDCTFAGNQAIGGDGGTGNNVGV